MEQCCWVGLPLPGGFAGNAARGEDGHFCSRLFCQAREVRMHWFSRRARQASPLDLIFRDEGTLCEHESSGRVLASPPNQNSANIWST